jgi:hypothetical protein
MRFSRHVFRATWIAHPFEAEVWIRIMASSTFFGRRRNMTWGSDPLIKNLLLSTDIPAVMDTGRDPEP